MLRKTVNKILKLRRKKSDPELDACRVHHDYDDDANAEESDTARVFRHAFIDQFESFRREADMLARGNAEFNDTWKDTIAREGLALTVTVVVGVVGFLGAISVLSAVVSAGIAIAVAVLAIVAGVAIYKYREHVKRNRNENADAIMDREDIELHIRAIASLLADVYQLQLSSCTVKDAHKLAESCMKVISEEMLRNKEFNLDELLNPATLQAVFMRSMTKIPKEKLDMNINTNKKFNTRGMISHSAYYCRETDEFYQSSKSKPVKYGVLFFDKKEDLEDYQTILAATLKGGEAWRLTKMRPHEVHLLMRSSMFKAYQNDTLFEGSQKLEVVEKPEGMKI